MEFKLSLCINLILLEIELYFEYDAVIATNDYQIAYGLETIRLLKSFFSNIDNCTHQFLSLSLDFESDPDCWTRKKALLDCGKLLETFNVLNALHDDSLILFFGCPMGLQMMHFVAEQVLQMDRTIQMKCVFDQYTCTLDQIRIVLKYLEGYPEDFGIFVDANEIKDAQTYTEMLKEWGIKM